MTIILCVLKCFLSQVKRIILWIELCSCNVFLGLRKEKFGLSRWGWNRNWQDSFEITWRKHGVIPLSAYLPVPDSDPSLPLWASLAWHSGRSKSLSNVSAQAALTPGTPMLICGAPKAPALSHWSFTTSEKASNIHTVKLQFVLYRKYTVRKVHMILASTLLVTGS